MHVFWERGYATTSLTDLLGVLGIGLSSFYNAFGSKQGLYLAALDRYGERTLAALCDALGGPAPVVPRLRAHFGRVAEESLRETPNRGCLLVNATVERAPHDPEVRRRVDEQFARNLEAFREALERARDAGEIGPAVDLPAAAAHLVNAYHGLRVTGKARKDPAVLAGIVDLTIAALGPPVPEGR